MRVLLISANRERLPSPVVPLGMLSVAGALRPAHDVRVVDLCFEADPHQIVRLAIAEFAPDVVGISIRNLNDNTYAGEATFLDAYARLAAVVRESTSAPLVLGGAGFSLRPEDLVTRLRADHGVVGEGERAFRALVDDLAAGKTPERLIRWSGSNQLNDLCRPARDLVDPRYYAHDGTDNIQTKRGCAFGCAYCSYPDIEGRQVRTRDPDSVADEVLERAGVPGVSHVFFVDSVFNAPYGHAISICSALEARGAPLPWTCYASPVNFDAKLVEAMVRGGCKGVEIGSDSGTDVMLTRLHKPFNLARITETHRLLAANNLRDCHTFVLGAFGETVDDARRTLDYVHNLDPDVAIFVVFHEERETADASHAGHRDAIRELLKEVAPAHAGWSVPELGIRFGEMSERYVRRMGWKGPSWGYLADSRRKIHLEVHR